MVRNTGRKRNDYISAMNIRDSRAITANQRKNVNKMSNRSAKNIDMDDMKKMKKLPYLVKITYT